MAFFSNRLRAAWRGALAMAAAAAAGMAAAQPASVWIGPDDGTWFNAAHWAGGVPALGSRAYIDGGRVVTPRGSPTAYAGTLVVGATAVTRLSSLGLASELGTVLPTIGLLPGSEGVVTVGSGGVFTVGFQGFLDIGPEGKGTMTVTRGGTLVPTGSIRIGRLAGGDGSLVLAGGVVNGFTGGIDVGRAGRGALTVTNGSVIDLPTYLLSLSQQGGQADVRVQGATTSLRVDRVDGATGARVSVEDGATLRALDIVAGGSSWSVLARSQVLADRLTLADSSRLAYALSDPTASGAGRVDARTLNMDGTLAITLDQGFVPALGDRWQLLSFAAASGAFDHLELPALEAGLRWDASALYTQGMLQVAAVPEPASALLFALGGLALASRARAAISRRQRRPAASA